MNMEWTVQATLLYCQNWDVLWTARSSPREWNFLPGDGEEQREEKGTGTVCHGLGQLIQWLS